MSLKSATQLVLGALGFSLLLSLAQWAVFTFSLLNYSKFVWLFRATELAQILLRTVPLILFFRTLNARQRGEPHG